MPGSGLFTEVLHLAQNEFLHEFHALYQGMPSGQAGSVAQGVICTCIQKLTFDSVGVLFQYILNIFLMQVVQTTLWDRAFGGATLILHVEGSTCPNTPKSPQHIKRQVYFPGYLIDVDPF